MVAKTALDLLISSRIIQNASKIIALNQREADQYKKIGVSQNKIAIVPNGLDLLKYSVMPLKGTFRKRFGISTNEKIVLYLGRIHQIKGIDILIKAFAEVVLKLDNVKLVIAGPDDGFLFEVESLIKILKIGKKVLFVGPLFGNEKLEAYVDADVYVLPSLYEAFPMGLLEAQKDRLESTRCHRPLFPK